MTSTKPKTEQDVVLSWRLERILGAGFKLKPAQRLAASDVDLAEIEALIAAGCPPKTVSRILL